MIDWQEYPEGHLSACGRFEIHEVDMDTGADIAPAFRLCDMQESTSYILQTVTDCKLRAEQIEKGN